MAHQNHCLGMHIVVVVAAIFFVILENNPNQHVHAPLERYT